MMAHSAPANRSRQGSASDMRDFYLARDVRLLRAGTGDPTREAPVRLVCLHVNRGYFLEGRVDVVNISYEKVVGLRITWDGWSTVHDVEGHYVSTHENANNELAASRTAETIEAPLDEDVPGSVKGETLKSALRGKPKPPPEPQPVVDRFFLRLDMRPHLTAVQAVSQIEIQACAFFKVPAMHGSPPKEFWDSNYGNNYRTLYRFPSAYESRLIKEFLPGYGLPRPKEGREKGTLTARYDLVDRIADQHFRRARANGSRPHSPDLASPVLTTPAENGYDEDGRSLGDRSNADEPGAEVEPPAKPTCECGD